MPNQRFYTYEHKVRYDAIGKLRMIACAEGYVMVRRTGEMPFVMDGKEWMALPTKPLEATPSKIL